MVRILTQDVDPVATRKPDLPPTICAVVDACLRRDRSQRSASAATVAQQLEGVLRDLKAARYGSMGRRATDRAAMQHGQPYSDPNVLGAPLDRPPRKVILMAAGVGVACGLIAVLIVILVSNATK
jgi:hypothetical protein